MSDVSQDPTPLPLRLVLDSVITAPMDGEQRLRLLAAVTSIPRPRRPRDDDPPPAA